MDRIKNKVWILSLVLLMLSLLAGCTNNSTITEAKKRVIKVGVSPNTKIIVDAAVPVMKEKGYTIETTVFDDFVQPNTALSEGNIDCNLYQHEPYMNAANESKSTDLVFINKIVLGTCGLYSNKYDSIDKLPENGRIAIFQDASNQDRLLRLLEKGGLIKLQEKEGLYTLLDIAENPKNFEFVTMDINQLVTGLDELDACCEGDPSLFLASTTPKFELLKEDSNDDFVLSFSVGLVANPRDAESQWIEDFVESFKEQDTKDAIMENFGGAYTPVAEK